MPASISTKKLNLLFSASEVQIHFSVIAANMGVPQREESGLLIFA
jgi:hypothetical protein